MIPEPAIWRAAQAMVKRYGDDAGTQAAMRADDLASSGDTDGAAVCRRIGGAVEALLRPVPAEGDAVH